MASEGFNVPVSFSAAAGGHDFNAGAQQMRRMAAGQFAEEQHNTMLPAESKPDLPPNMRNWTRWEYLEEFVGYWKYEHVTRILAVALLALGILTLEVFTPGALLMIAVSARFFDLAWWYNLIVHKFGNHRSLVLVD